MRSMVAGSVRDRDRMLVESTVDCYLDLDLRGVHCSTSTASPRSPTAATRPPAPRLEAWLAATDTQD